MYIKQVCVPEWEGGGVLFFLHSTGSYSCWTHGLNLAETQR